MTNDNISEEFGRLCDDFSAALKAHRDHSVTLVDKATGQVLETRPLRAVAILDLAHNVKHAGIVIERTEGIEAGLPEIATQELSATAASVHVSTSEVGSTRFFNESNALTFSRAVYVYVHETVQDSQALTDAFEKSDLKLFIRDKVWREEAFRARKPDVFVCHDSADKESFVKPLATALARRFLKVWYDEFQITVGDSIVEKVDSGLKECRYGVVVISKEFLSRKKWSNREFRSLSARETEEGKKVILPIWLNVTREDVAAYSLDLADKYALASTLGVDAIADKIKVAITTAK